MPEQTHSHSKLFLWLGLLIALLFALSIFAFLFSVEPSGQNGSMVTSEAIRIGEASRPAFTQATQERVRTSAGFQALVSFTDRGFEPAGVEIGAGETVRFTNNSSQPVDLEIDGGYASIEPQDFYEHSYPTEGDWVYRGGGAEGVVQVR